MADKQSNYARKELYGDWLHNTPMELWTGTGRSEADYVRLPANAQKTWNTYAQSRKQQAQSGMRRTESPFNNNTQYGFSSPLSTGLASSLINSDTNVPIYGKNQPSLWDKAQSTFTGTSPFKYDTGVKDNRIGYIDEYGNQAYTGVLDSSTLDIAKDLYSNNSNIFGNASQTGTGIGGLASSVWDSIGGAKGFNDIMGGLGTGMSMYLGYEQNKRAKDEHNQRMAEINRQKQRDVDFANAINKSGLGSYSAGVK